MKRMLLWTYRPLVGTWWASAWGRSGDCRCTSPRRAAPARLSWTQTKSDPQKCTFFFITKNNTVLYFLHCVLWKLLFCLMFPLVSLASWFLRVILSAVPHSRLSSASCFPYTEKFLNFYIFVVRTASKLPVFPFIWLILLTFLLARMFLSLANCCLGSWLCFSCCSF